MQEFLRRSARPFAVAAARAGLRGRILKKAQKIWLWRKVNHYFTYEGVSGWRRCAWGDEVYCDAADFIQKHVYFFGVWEPALTRYIRTKNKSGGVFVDIGANIGYFSLLASTVFRKVMAFEASPSIYRLFTANIERNGKDNINAVNLAIGADFGEAVLSSGPRNNIGKTSFMRPKDSLARTGLEETVSMAPLVSQLNADELAAVKLIKIDVEGAEPAVVDGLMDSLPVMSDDLELVVEVTPDDTGEVRRMYEKICAAGFVPHVLAGAYALEEYLVPQTFAAAPPTFCTAFPSEQTDILFRRA